MQCFERLCKKWLLLHTWVLALLVCLSVSPGHHLFFLVGGMATAADWMDGCGQEVQPVVFKVLIHQWQDHLRVEWHVPLNACMLKQTDLQDLRKQCALTFPKNLICCSCGTFSPFGRTPSSKDRFNIFRRGRFGMIYRVVFIQYLHIRTLVQLKTDLTKVSRYSFEIIIFYCL